MSMGYLVGLMQDWKDLEPETIAKANLIRSLVLPGYNECEEVGDILAHAAYIIARDGEHLETCRKNGDRFAAICAGFAASVERCEVFRQSPDLDEFLRAFGAKK